MIEIVANIIGIVTYILEPATGRQRLSMEGKPLVSPARLMPLLEMILPAELLFNTITNRESAGEDLWDKLLELRILIPAMLVSFNVLLIV